MQGNISKTLVSDLAKRIKREPLSKPLEIRDASLKGFILRVQPSGAMSYVVQITRGKRLTIGRAPAVTPTRAREKARIALGAAADGKDPRESLRMDAGSTTPTLSKYVEDRYAPWLAANRKTGAELVARLKACFYVEFGDTPLDQITAWNAEKWRKTRKVQGRAVGTINRDLSTLKAALSRAVDWELIERNPLDKVKPGREDRLGVARYLSGDEERRLRASLDARDAQLRQGRARGNAWRRERGQETMPEIGTYADHLAPLVLLSINTGIRQGEAFNLKWPDVDLDRASIVIRGDAAKSGSTRHIPLNDEALEVVRSWGERGDGYVFPSRSGGRLDNVKKAWGGILKAASITGFRWHDMRHHFASRLVMAGVDLNTVRELLGHSDLKMTLRYAHLAPEHKAAAVAKLTEGAL